MATTLETFFTGKHVYSITIEPLSRAATGVLNETAASADVFTLISGTNATAGVVDGITYSGRNVVEDISPISSPRENFVPIHRDDRITITEIMRTTADQNILARVWNDVVNSVDAEYCRVIIRRGQVAGTSTSEKVSELTLIGVMTEYRENIRPGKKTSVMEIAIVEIPGVANPAFVTETIAS